MARPVVTETSEELYDSLGPITDPDPDTDYQLLAFVAAVGDLLDRVNVLARDTDDGPGWSSLLDPDRAPSEGLGFLGQFAGVSLLNGLDDASQRLRVREAAGMRRGTVAAMQGAARQWLTGSRQVLVFERDTSPYHLTVRTYQAETPDPASTEATLRAEKPAGLVLAYEVTSGATYAQIDAAFGTYADMDGLGTYEDQTLYVP